MIKRRRSIEQQNKSKQVILPVLPLPERVIFPNMTCQSTKIYNRTQQRNTDADYERSCRQS
jgi:hypothetical protein